MSSSTSHPQPLQGIRILEFTHAVMGPSCGMILADLGAEVVFVEAPEGSPTRSLRGFGSGYFPYFGRSKKSLGLDLKSPQGLALARALVEKADVLIENFAPGTMEKLGLGARSCRALNPRLIYCAMKGFLNGPYENRAALDEVVQMMGGLAYMTGPKGRPLRVGSSVVDITGGMFGVIGILAALRERDHSGEGQTIKSSLFETTAFLMGQHLAWSVIAEEPIPPMPERVSAWAVYQIFETRDEPLFIGVISDKHWQTFCSAFAREDLAQNPLYASNNQRIAAREQLIPELKQMLSLYSRAEAMERCESAAIPYAPIARPEDLFEDVHLNQGGGLEEQEFPEGQRGKLPRLPLEWNGSRFPIKARPPRVGEHNREILESWLGYDAATAAAALPQHETEGSIKDGTSGRQEEQKAEPTPGR